MKFAKEALFSFALCCGIWFSRSINVNATTILYEATSDCRLTASNGCQDIGLCIIANQSCGFNQYFSQGNTIFRCECKVPVS